MMNLTLDIAWCAFGIGMIGYALSLIMTIIQGRFGGYFVSTVTTALLGVTVMALLSAVSLSILKLLGVAG